jgi:hypothetical protein
MFMQEINFSSKGVQLNSIANLQNIILTFSKPIIRWQLLCIRLAPTSSPLWCKNKNKLVYSNQ